MNVFIISRGLPSKKYPLYGIFELDQACALSKAGNNVVFIAIDFREFFHWRKWGLFCSEYRGIHVYNLSIPLGMYRRCLPLLQYLLSLVFRLAKRKHGKPDIVHAHFYSIGAIASVLKRKFNVPLVITEHSSKLNKDISLLSKLDIKLANFAYQNADAIIAVSNCLSTNLRNNFNIQSYVVNNIVDCESFKFVNRTKQDKFSFVSVGNLIPRKCFGLLIDSFKMANFPENVSLKIIGDGIEMNDLKNKIENLELSQNICLLGNLRREKIYEEMKQCDAFVLASQNETFGVVLIEAMFTGLPVVSTKCGGPEEFVNSNNGILVPTNDSAAMCEALKQMYNNYGHFEPKLISNDCINRFSNLSIAQKISEVYNQVKF